MQQRRLVAAMAIRQLDRLRILLHAADDEIIRAKAAADGRRLRAAVINVREQLCVAAT